MSAFHPGSPFSCRSAFDPLRTYDCWGTLAFVESKMRFRITCASLGAMMIASLLGGTSQAHNSSGPKPVIIPKRFQAEWRADLKWCPPEISDMIEWIGAKKMRFGHFVGEAKAVRVHSPRNITVAASLLSDGEPFEGNIKMRLSKSGDQLKIDFGEGEKLRYRCPD